jgi:hypothetical protein
MKTLVQLAAASVATYFIVVYVLGLFPAMSVAMLLRF